MSQTHADAPMASLLHPCYVPQCLQKHHTGQLSTVHTSREQEKEKPLSGRFCGTAGHATRAIDTGLWDFPGKECSLSG